MTQSLQFKLTALLFLFISISGIQAQELHTYFKEADPKLSWVKLNDEMTFTPQSFFKMLQEEFGLPQETEMKIASTVNETNWSHTKYQQYYKGVPVEGAQYILHENKKRIDHANGVIQTQINVDIDTRMSVKDALFLAEKHVGVKHDAEAIIHGDHTHLAVEPELVIVNALYPLEGGDFLLAYKMDVYSRSPLTRQRVFLDAKTGDIIKSYSILMDCMLGDTARLACLHHGNQIAPNEKSNDTFYLMDKSRGGGIFCMGIRKNIFFDMDNIWENTTQDYRNGAHDMFWGSQRTYDYFKETFNRNGIDGKGGPVLATVDTTLPDNARWDGTGIIFGIGNATYRAFSAIDVVGHEFMHGVTEHTAGLEYLYEAGAMNEAYSDIFGKAIEWYADPTRFDWYIGSKVVIAQDGALRDMSNPARFSDPAYYKGQFWAAGSGDNGGVHTNSGVLNYWYHLLVDGKKGTNEKGQDFDVTAIGWNEASQLAYDILTKYLTKTSSYYDARNASLQLIESKYGRCSDYYKNIAEAWYAVGIGARLNESDFQLVNNKITTAVCRDGYYAVQTRLVNLSCNSTFTKGTEITMSFKIDTFPTVTEQYMLQNDFKPGDHVLYNFATLGRALKTGNNKLSVTAFISTDVDTSNNRFEVTLVKNNSTDYDFRIQSISLNGNACPGGGNYRVNVFCSYGGCAPIPVNIELQLQLMYPDSLVIRKFNTITTTYPGGFVRIPSFELSRNFKGVKQVGALLIAPNDTTLANNRSSFQILFLDYTSRNEVETFTGNVYDLNKLAIASDTFNNQNVQMNAFLQSEAIHITGETVYDTTNRFLPVKNNEAAGFITANRRYTSTMYLCANVANLINPRLEFDLVQDIGITDYSIPTNFQDSFALITRVTFRAANGNSPGQEYFINGKKEPVLQKISIAIPPNTVSVEILNLALHGVFDPITKVIDPKGDITSIDNIVIVAEGVKVRDYLKDAFSIIPNPTNSEFQIILGDALLGQEGKLNILNSLGQIIDTRQIGNSDHILNINTPLLPGTYFINYQMKNGKTSSEILIKQ